jgi:hypothetical protein
MIDQASELRQAAQMWKNLYDQQTVSLAAQGEQFNEAFEALGEEVELARAVTYMILWNNEFQVEVSQAEIEAFNAKSEEDGDWSLDIAGDDATGFTITLERVGEEVLDGETLRENLPYLDDVEGEIAAIEEEENEDATESDVVDDYQADLNDEG